MKKKLQQEHEEELEQKEKSKKALERKVGLQNLALCLTDLNQSNCISSLNLMPNQWFGDINDNGTSLLQVTDARAETEEHQRQVGNFKRKCQRLTQDVGDMKLHLQEQMMRNAELEKKQRK